MAAKVKTSVLTVHDVPYVVGMEWSVGMPARMDADRKKAIDSVGSHFGVMQKGVSELRIGIATSADKGKLSAAAVLAKRHPNIILVQQVGDDQFWLTLVSRGLVFPRSDFVGTIGEVQERVKDLTSKMSTVEEGMRTCAPDLSALPMFSKFEQTAFDTLIGDYEATKTETVRSLAPMVTRERLFVGIAIGAAAFVFLNPHGKPPNVVKAVTAAVTTAPAPTMSPAQRLQKYMSLVTTQLSQESPSKRKAALDAAIQRYWPITAGWELQTISIADGQPTQAILTRPESSTVDALSAVVGQDASVSFSDDGSSATISLKASTQPTGALPQVSLTSARDAHMHLESDFENSRIKLSIKQGTIAALTPGMDIKQTLMLGPNDSLPGQVFEWSTEVPYSDLDAIFSILSKYPTLGVSQLTYKRSAGSERVGLTGVIYEPI